MRWSGVVVLVFLVPLALGQGFTAEDAEGDVQFAVFTLVAGEYQYVPAPAGYEHVDMLSVEVGEETETSFDVAVTFAAQPNVQSPVSLGDPELRFQYGGAEYLITFGPCDGAANLAVLNTGSGRFDNVACLEGGTDGTTKWATVPKALIRDKAGVPSSFGSSLTDFRAELWELVAFTPAGVGTTYAVDFAPDTDVFDETFSFTLGQGGLGDLRWSAPSAIRASNGGPDTFLYGIHITNDGPAARLAVSMSAVPAQWDVRVAPIVQVPAESSIVLPVAVTTRTAHAHGGTETFRVELALADEPDTSGFVELGIHYLDVPQLAGHHPELFVHGATYQVPYADVLPATRYTAWMNTLRDAPGAEPVMVPPGGGGFGGVNAAGTAFYSGWDIPMDPKLLIGIDFEVGATAELVAGFQVDDELPGEVTLAAVLWHCNPKNNTGHAQAPSLPCPGGDWHEMARGMATPVTMPLSGPFDIEVELEPNAYADLVPYVDGSNVALELVMGRDVAPPMGGFPDLDPLRTSLRLPLNEYRDPLDESFSQIGTLRLDALSPFEKKANAGQSVWFRFQVHNEGEARDVALSLFGHNQAWASLVQDQVRVGSDGAEVTVRVDIPKGASPGDFAELFLLVEDKADATQAAMSKLRAVAVSQPVAAEEPPAAVPEEKKDSPGLPVLVLLGALVAVALRRR